MPNSPHKNNRLWLPNDAREALSAWYDGNDLNSIVLNGTTVSQWRDKSANANHVSQATSANQPTLTRNAYGRRSAITFNGSSSYLAASSLNGVATGTLKNSIYIVSKFTGSVANTVVPLGYGALSSNAIRGVYPQASAGSITVWLFGSDFETSTTWPASLSIITAFYDTSLLAYLNGTSLGSSANTMNTGTTNPLTLGASVNASFFFQGDIAEVLLINGERNQRLQNTIEGYLAWKWGLQGSLPTTHPFYHQAPLATF